MPGPIRSVRVWINAFIPGHVPGYTGGIASGPNAGLTVLYGVGPSPFGYLTDQRGFSPSLDAKCQMQSLARVDLTTARPKLSEWHRCDFSLPLGSSSPGAAADWQAESIPSEQTAGDSQADAADAAESRQMRVTLVDRSSSQTAVAVRRLGPVAMHTRAASSRAGGSHEIIQLYFECSARLPCAVLAAHFGDIRYQGLVTIELAERSVEFNGTVHRFPAFEMYAALDNTPAQPLFRISPPRGDHALDRPAAAQRAARGRVTFE
jgi:hypothetical protein